MADSVEKLTVDAYKTSLQFFTGADYAVLVVMLGICTMIGVYFGLVDYLKRKRATTSDAGAEAADYLMGGRDMGVIPIALSLTASFVSGSVLLGKLKH